MLGVAVKSQADSLDGGKYLTRRALCEASCEQDWQSWTWLGGDGIGRRPPEWRKHHVQFPPPLLHLVEQPDVRNPILDAALRRVCRRGRVREPVLPNEGRQGGPNSRLRAALGDLQR